MISFTCVPAMPANYARLRALSVAELALARADGYVDDAVDPRRPVNRAGKDFSFQPLPTDDIGDWRTKVFVIWFCYIYENLRELAKPMGAIEELITEFKAPSLLDISGKRLGTLYAGAGAADPLSANALEREVEDLRPHYDKAIVLLNSITS